MNRECLRATVCHPVAAAYDRASIWAEVLMWSYIINAVHLRAPLDHGSRLQPAAASDRGLKQRRSFHAPRCYVYSYTFDAFMRKQAGASRNAVHTAQRRDVT